MKINFDYDSENDILYFYPDEGSVDFSIDYDDIILDVRGNRVVGVEIINASEKFAENEVEIGELKQAMDSLKEAYMNVKYGMNSIFIKLGFVFSSPANKREGMLIQVPVKKELMLEV